MTIKQEYLESLTSLRNTLSWNNDPDPLDIATAVIDIIDLLKIILEEEEE